MMKRSFRFNESLRDRCTCSSDIPPKLILDGGPIVDDASHNLTGSPEKEEIVHTGATLTREGGGTGPASGRKKEKNKKKGKKI